MDCPICYNIIINSSIGSCTHHFCTKCLLEWCKYGGTTCPKCNIFISEIRSDPEFDSINNTDSVTTNSIISDSINKYNKIRTINLKQNDKAGITLINNYVNNYRAPGIRISKINNKYKLYESGLRKNDILISINNIPCINHKQTIDIIDACILSNKQIICMLL
jgi:hypothetical protein